MPDEPPRRWSALVGLLIFAAIGFALLPPFAESDPAAYVSFAVAFVLSAAGAGYFERTRGLSHRPQGKTPIAAIVGATLILRAIHVPALRTGVLGGLTGALVGMGVMVTLEMRRKKSETAKS